jgi:DNA repair exonuclease SbcCD nuclease subunit
MAPRLRIIRDHGGELLHFEDLDLVVWGRGYLDSDWHFRPLDGIPERLDDRWHVAMAHGHFVRADGDHSRSLLIHEHELEGVAGHWDYLALGHWEPHADISHAGLTAVYSGAPIALSDVNKKAGWAAVIDFADDGVSWYVDRVDPREKRWSEP